MTYFHHKMNAELVFMQGTRRDGVLWTVTKFTLILIWITCNLLVLNVGDRPKSSFKTVFFSSSFKTRFMLHITN